MLPVKLTDGVVLLTAFTLDDVETHLEGEDAEQVKWLSGGKSTRESVENWIRRNQQWWDEDGPVYNFAVREAQSNELVGMVEANRDLQQIDGLKAGDANISYGLYPQHRGKGYVTKALVLLEQFLAHRGVQRGVIRVEPENAASIAVPQRLGYEAKGSIIARDGTELLMFAKKLWS